MEIELRLILLGVGAIILMVVAYDMFKRKTANQNNKVTAHNYDKARPTRLPMVKMPLTEDYAEPVLDIYQNQAAAILPAELDVAVDPEPEDIVSTSAAVTKEKHRLLAISIMSREPYGFDGAALLAALEGAQFVFGKNDIFHRIEDEEILFSAVNAIEPGYFILETLTDEHVPGLTLFLLPEGLSNPQQAFDKFIRAAKQIAFALNGELMDDMRQPLTLEQIEQYRKQVSTIPNKQR